MGMIKLDWGESSCSGFLRREVGITMTSWSALNNVLDRSPWVFEMTVILRKRRLGKITISNTAECDVLGLEG